MSAEEVFKKPTSSNIKWKDLVNALAYCGFYLDKKGSGSKRSFKNQKNQKIFIHEPHGSNSLPKGDIDRVRDKLDEFGAR